jgi:hypothetical protein
MGRSLSKLQRFILAEAARRPRLHYTDVLHHFFGFQSRRQLVYTTENGTRSSWDEGGQLDGPAGQKFSPKEIGERRYHYALASLSRACTRLQARGMVICIHGVLAHWAAVKITDAGREWLTVNKVVISPQVNR